MFFNAFPCVYYFFKQYLPQRRALSLRNVTLLIFYCSKSVIRASKSFLSMSTLADLHRFVHIFISSSKKAVRIFFFYSTLSERTLSAFVSSAFFTAARSLNPLSAESRAPIAVTAPAMTPAMPEEDSSCPPLTDNKAV